MKLSVLMNLYADKPFKEVCEILSKQGVQAVEIGCGGYPGKDHCNPEVMLQHPEMITEMLDVLKANNLEIAALSTHGNPVHPNKEIAKQFHDDFENAVLLYEKINEMGGHVDTIVTFSGCPGGSPEDKTPNWATAAWPPDFLDVLDYQWNQVLIPYWKKEAAFAESHGVKKIAFEMHPGFCVYNPETLMKIRNAVGPIIGANFDPSHLFWQGINPVNAIRYLGENNAIHYFHAKDTKIDEQNTAVNGVLDTKLYTDELHRSWIFRSLGYGHDISVWKDIMSTLRKVGYDGYISIEHEDSLMSVAEGLAKAIAVLKESMIFEEKRVVTWA